MVRAAGEVADGIHVHPLHSMHYIEHRLVPQMAEGAQRAGRSADEIDLIIPVFAVPGDTPEERAEMVQRAKTQIAFYGSTKNYAFQFDDLGYEGTSAKLNQLLKAGDLAGMADTITDEMLDQYAVVAPWDELADALIGRYRGRAARLVLYLTADHLAREPSVAGRWGEIARAVAAA
jgi:alkanesulfonate monooxygenase SsuD/methylene tetrahydromethanopterin reductase-like flavin-dependent oxidoreductase (luciferase family)